MIINGVEYEARELPRRGKKLGTLASLTVALAGMYMSGMGGGHSRKRPDVDIATEFELIQNKQSKLSRNDREWVVYQFNQLYKIKTTQNNNQ